MSDETAPAEQDIEDKVETDALCTELAGLKEQVLRYAAPSA